VTAGINSAASISGSSGVNRHRRGGGNGSIGISASAALAKA